MLQQKVISSRRAREHLGTCWRRKANGVKRGGARLLINSNPLVFGEEMRFFVIEGEGHRAEENARRGSVRVGKRG